MTHIYNGDNLTKNDFLTMTWHTAEGKKPKDGHPLCYYG